MASTIHPEDIVPPSYRAIKNAANSFQSPLIVQYEDGRDWVIYQEFTYCSERVCVHIPAGFATDFASIPRFLWRIISPTDREIGKPAVVHDYLYRTPTVAITREQADRELMLAMECVGAPWWKRKLVYAGVRLGGTHAFRPRKTEDV